MKLSACLIVKNEAENLAKTLPVLAQGVDELIILDTGSTDQTVPVAQSFGAKVFHCTWKNDFAAARNESLKHASGDWLLWIDADEFISADDLKQLNQELSLTKDTACCVALFESPLGQCEKKSGYQRVKVFKNGLGYHFIRPINEQLVDQNNQVIAGPEIPVAIYHWGKDLGEKKMTEKRERYVALYSQALEARPGDAYFHFLLANNLNELKRLPEALDHYVQASKYTNDQGLICQTMEKIADLLLRLKQLSQAAMVAEQLLALEPNNIPARNVLASVNLVNGRTEAAVKLLLEVLDLKTDGAITDFYQAKFMPCFLLSKAYQLKGEADKAQFYAKQAAQLAPKIRGIN
ncbi:hypothetical protein COT42_03060 [Candidatus Saganbacteria bacterium CG08_land_8_20_14_0_20_45_16]|uniref:Glycosyltransferase 2-like domain-containing protein n=1 Tax=Candidatus Saganbacteria bacterium CG08_land_8_20_14_0_20_45_16 TaxID=2014293 RepID=A0A2H0XZC5_UNCSA|nr:MAG: hypothetical protein COT42_03060 [Candidatus Saganbacteria bacterium CG08_land_8_20_14_0_20_45_16]